MDQQHAHKQKGFSLIEVILFTSLISLIFVASASILATSLRTSQMNEQKLLATRYAEELNDWLSGQKDEGWNGFVSHTPTPDVLYTFCFQSFPPDGGAWTSGSCESTQQPILNGNARYYRDLEIKHTSSTDQVQATITVTAHLLNGQTSISVPLYNTFSQWQ